MILSDRDIRAAIEAGDIEIDPYEPDNVEPASVDLTLGNHFIIFDSENSVLDTLDYEPSEMGREVVASEFTIHPETAVLATTKERVRVPDYLGADVKGRSTLGRLFIEMHQTAGWIDPGWNGEITLELKNNNTRPITVHEGQRVCQVLFKELTSPAEKPYGHEKSQYQNQSGATPPGTRF